MQRCKICKIPLSGLLGNVGKLFFKVKPSSQNPEICSKCADKQHQVEKQRQAQEQKQKSPGKYRCQICERMIEEEHALMHAKAEEYLINLIKKDHPQWQQGSPTCKECVEYYRKLIKEAEI